MYVSSQEYFNRIFVAPRLGYYLQLMQLGRQYSLGKDTLDLLEIINTGDRERVKDPSKDLKLCLRFPFEELIRYHKASLIPE